MLKVSELSVRNEIVRAKLTVPNDNMDMLTVIGSHLEEQFAELERMYRKEMACAEQAVKEAMPRGE